MFQVLVFVYENYWRGDACPQGNQLERKLNAVGFDTQEIQDALAWLNGLSQATRTTRPGDDAKRAPHDRDDSVQQTDRQAIANSGASMRVFSAAEHSRLGADCLGFIRFLENAAALAPHIREIVVDRAMACDSEPLSLDDLKIIVLLVYWSFGEEPDALVRHELCDDAQDRVAH